jgi:hypothetical protein
MVQGGGWWCGNGCSCCSAPGGAPLARCKCVTCFECLILLRKFFAASKRAHWPTVSRQCRTCNTPGASPPHKHTPLRLAHAHTHTRTPPCSQRTYAGKACTGRRPCQPGERLLLISACAALAAAGDQWRTPAAASRQDMLSARSLTVFVRRVCATGTRCAAWPARRTAASSTSTSASTRRTRASRSRAWRRCVARMRGADARRESHAGCSGPSDTHTHTRTHARTHLTHTHTFTHTPDTHTHTPEDAPALAQHMQGDHQAAARCAPRARAAVAGCRAARHAERAAAAAAASVAAPVTGVRRMSRAVLCAARRLPQGAQGGQGGRDAGGVPHHNH